MPKKKRDRPDDAYYVRIPGVLWTHPHLSDKGFRLYEMLLSYDHDGTGIVWPSRRTLAERLRWSQPTISRHIKELERWGYVSCEFMIPPGHQREQIVRHLHLRIVGQTVLTDPCIARALNQGGFKVDERGRERLKVQRYRRPEEDTTIKDSDVSQPEPLVGTDTQTVQTPATPDAGQPQPPDDKAKALAIRRIADAHARRQDEERKRRQVLWAKTAGEPPKGAKGGA